MKRMLLVLLGLMVFAPMAMGQPKDFPNKTVKVIVPYTAGSGSDTSARFFGEKLSGMLGQPFVVENKPGASGVLSVMAVKAAPADGYSILLVGTSQLAVTPFTIKDLPYDPNKDLKPLAGLTRGMNVFIAPPNSKLQTLADLVATAKRDKELLNVGTYAAGYQLALEWFASMAGVKFTNVPYKGGAPIFTDIMGGQLDFAVADLGGVASLLKSGKIRALAVSGEKRHPDFPDVPTIKESGYPEYVNYSCTSLYDALQKVLATNEAKEYVRKTGAELMPHTPAAMEKYQRDEYARFRRIAELAGIKPE
ncbi:MAG: tripartite tricarboxylate transporter substrate binding protein [Proteobacteria bacterium]|nr:tripartite tricarboxylate transporter substrate binding protein [Pseudomonadota bacterium]